MEASGERSHRNGTERKVAVGIVVSYGNEEHTRPSVSAFVWGRRVEKHLNLRYGRWKDADR